MSTTRTPVALMWPEPVRRTMQVSMMGLYIPPTLFMLRERQFPLYKMRLPWNFCSSPMSHLCKRTGYIRPKVRITGHTQRTPYVQCEATRQHASRN